MSADTRGCRQTIAVQCIRDGEERAQSLSRRFGRHVQTVEDSIFMVMRRLVPEHHTASWHSYELSNGGFYMAPDLRVAQRVRNLMTGEYREMSPDAAGLAASLLALRHLSTQTRNDGMARHYFQLREFVTAHPEAAEILASID